MYHHRPQDRLKGLAWQTRLSLYTNLASVASGAIKEEPKKWRSNVIQKQLKSTPVTSFRQLTKANATPLFGCQ